MNEKDKINDFKKFISIMVIGIFLMGLASIIVGLGLFLLFYLNKIFFCGGFVC